MKKQAKKIVLAAFALTLLTCGAARAESTSTAESIKALQAQVNALQKQLGEMQTKAAAEAAKPAPAPVAAAPEEKKEILPGVNVKLGGFVAMEGVYRSKEMTTDMGSSFANIPYDNQIKSKTDEFRGSARATRLSLLADGKPDADTKLTAYLEADFMGSGTISNNVQTNSYDPRLRQAFAQVDRSDWGFHFLAGQAFSMTTLYKEGLTARKEAGVPMIDNLGSPGYVYTRSPGVRFVKDYADGKGAVGLSFESPEVNFGGLTPPAHVTARNTGLSPLNTGTSYSTNVAPDVVLKTAYDTSVGHFEVFGLTRFFHDVYFNTATASAEDNYAMGYGIGGGAYIPLLGKKAELAVNVMAGRGIGRYSAGQMPDIAFKADGGIRPVEMMSGMVGVIAHPTSTWDLYTYVGAERAMRDDQGATANTGYGYSNANLNNCYTLAESGTCAAQTQFVWQVTPGFWKEVYKGSYGQMKVGGQYAYMRKMAFSGANDKTPSADDNVFMVSFRYSPF